MLLAKSEIDCATEQSRVALATPVEVRGPYRVRRRAVMARRELRGLRANNRSLVLETTTDIATGTPFPAAMGAARGIASTGRARKTAGQWVFSTILVIIWLGVAGGALTLGFDYYATPLQERPFSDLHEQFKPSGLIGQGMGIIGTAMMLVGVVMYSLRRRVRWLARAGKLATWLQIHIFLCTLGPVLVLFHTSFKFGGIISIAFWSMCIVVASGVFGRYLYGHIPKTIHGQFRSLESLEEQQAELVTSISADFGVETPVIERIFPRRERRKATGFLPALALAVGYDFSRRTQRRRIGRLLDGASNSSGGRGRRRSDEVPLPVRESVVGLVQSQLLLRQQIVLLEPFQRLFRYWHLLHLPLAGVMLLILVVHVAVAIMFGYTWIF